MPQASGQPHPRWMQAEGTATTTMTLDTPHHSPNTASTHTMMSRMGRRRRNDGAAAVQLNARVLPTNRDAVSEAAAASGVTVSLYVDMLYSELLAKYGALPRVTASRSEPPITTT